MLKKILLLTLILSSVPSFAQNQSEDDLEVINLEGLYKNTPSNKANATVQQTDLAAPSQEANSTTAVDDSVDKSDKEAKVEEIQVDELKDLSRLVPFREVSVIQKKYLPKTQRLQLYGSLATTTNTPWFLNYGAKLNLAYHFSEGFGIELNTLFLTSTERQVAKEIREQNNLKPEQFIYTKGYYGLDLIWSPIYGKLSYIDGGIVPFDMYFTVGGGVSDTNSQEKNVSTIHLGTGQIFALSKGMAFRWDYSLNVFEASPISSSSATAPAKGSYTDLILTAGVSFFFPEAGGR